MYPKLEKWYMVELTNLVFMGKIYNDPEIPDGTEVITQPFVDINSDYRLLFTSTKTYYLGEPDKVWLNTQISLNHLN